MPNAILVGHSYIARLDAARILHPDIPSDFNVKGCSISFIAKGGARIDTIRNLTQTIARRQPHCIFLQIGGNDIQGIFRPICTTVFILATVLSTWPNTFCVQHHVRKVTSLKRFSGSRGNTLNLSLSKRHTIKKYMRLIVKLNPNFMGTTI